MIQRHFFLRNNEALWKIKKITRELSERTIGLAFSLSEL